MGEWVARSVWPSNCARSVRAVRAVRASVACGARAACGGSAARTRAHVAALGSAGAATARLNRTHVRAPPP